MSDSFGTENNVPQESEGAADEETDYLRAHGEESAPAADLEPSPTTRVGSSTGDARDEDGGDVGSDDRGDASAEPSGDSSD
ncbi:hypothetical protein [Plantibacter sp. YIM 135249]|uniref:hypothetical protein n=1 Tax=Plantibacter sp. YIM 135249 TaxID=3423918 RepID=UPI003D34348F